MSWRLHDESAAKSPVVQRAFGRGMDMANSDDGSLDDRLEDSESVASHERQSLLRHSTGDMRTHCKGQDKNGSMTRARTLNVTEAEEIWGELEDDASVFVPPSAVGHASPVSTLGRVQSDGDAGVRNSTTMPRAESGRIRVQNKRVSMPAPHRTEPESSSRSERRDPRSQEPLMGWWRWQWWRQRPKDDAL